MNKSVNNFSFSYTLWNALDSMNVLNISDKYNIIYSISFLYPNAFLH